MTRPPHICFVAPSAYPVLARDKSVNFVGGAEVQQTTLAREFVRRGFAVSMICMDFGQPDNVVIDGVRVLRVHRPDEGIPVLRFVYPRLTMLWKAMRLADADIYYQRASGSLTGFVAAFASQNRRAFVFAAAHDADFQPELPLIRLARDRWLYRWGVRRATHVVVQTEAQRLACLRHFDRHAGIIRSCYESRGEPARFDGDVLWVANLLPYKRPELFVELARRCPEFQFRLVGGGAEEASKGVADAARGLSNIALTGFVPYADVEHQFDGAAVFVNTSTGEGFPNTFLQAWSRGMPTISFFDPGASLGGESICKVVVSVDQMAEQLRAMRRDRAVWEQRSRLCKAYFDQHHSVAQAADAYARLFDDRSTSDPAALGRRAA